MSHSQWEKKKYKKAASEGKTSKLYTKLVRLITTEAKIANGNKEATGLKSAISKAKKVNMPLENIERAIKKATEHNSQMETIIYEAYGPEGVGLIVVSLTENRNKASQEIRHILSKHGSSLGAIGSVAWGFEKQSTEDGFIWIPLTEIGVSEDGITLLDKLIEDLEDNDEVQEVFTNAK